MRSISDSTPLSVPALSVALLCPACSAAVSTSFPVSSSATGAKSSVSASPGSLFGRRAGSLSERFILSGPREQRSPSARKRGTFHGKRERAAVSKVAWGRRPVQPLHLATSVTLEQSAPHELERSLRRSTTDLFTIANQFEL